MNKRNLIIAGCVLLAVAGGIFLAVRGTEKKVSYKTVTPFIGTIESAISATGTVQPQNRLAVKPPIGGRIEEILVVEGQKVGAGEVLALMSSTDRAALIDAARLQGDDVKKNWDDVYRPIPLMSPIEADVIVRGVEPGQTVTQADAVIVLSDRLIVKAQVDETDIGKVKLGQEALITLDAYPDIEVKALVDHISYESVMINNVTIYTVDIVPEKVPPVFRSGMSANVQIIQERAEGLLLLPEQAVQRDQGRASVLIGQGSGRKPQSREIELGRTDGDNVEVIKGLSLDERILQVDHSLASKGGSGGRTNPFMPSRPGSGRKGR